MSHRLPAALAAVLFQGVLSVSQAAGLPALIEEAVSTDPAILEARANEEVAGSRAEATRAQHYPTLGAQAGSYLSNPADYSQPFRGVVGRVNLYAAGSIDSAIERDTLKQQSLRLHTVETRETVATNVTGLYLEALRSKELMESEQRNLKRHEKIIGDLEVVVANDRGRRYELVQAQSRALQVRMRIVDYEKAMKLALSRLTRYTRQTPTLEDPLGAEWRARLPADTVTRVHPGVQAQQREAESVRFDQRTLERQRWPRVDLEAGVGNQSYTRVVLNWAFFDRSADYTAQSAARQIVAAERRGELLERDVAERSATAEADMAQSQLQIKAAEQQIGASASVVELYELQFKVGRRSLIELVNAYAELASVEASRVMAQNDYRRAVASYLSAHAVLADWAQNVSTSAPRTP
ncbi:TolC family protein [Ottowia sp. VDI28]|uniref:TolC family protein n=1 Tax=Ottowia sp. VDI28 TaxID=3133968 RepID=UPI003C2C6778